MASEFILRGSINSSQHSTIDAELKALKLLSRRLQSALTSHATEFQLLQRLYYKNKNQHRGALFWRNVVEMQRYSERIKKLSLSDLLNGLRSSFHGTETPNMSLTKGPWTHFPREKYLSTVSRRFETVQKITDKMSDACLRAYQSFYCSSQSAAFLQIHLMFIAISSRMRAIAVELRDISIQATSCTSRLFLFLHQEGAAKVADATSDILLSRKSLEAEGGGINAMTAILPTGPPVVLPLPQISALLAVSQVCAKLTTAPIVIERKKSSKSRAPEEGAKRISASVFSRKKKKREGARNEIDDIFTF